MEISRRSNRAVWTLLSACFLLALFCGVGSAANITPDSLNRERVIFGGISGNYTVNYFDTSWHTDSCNYTGPVIWQAAQTAFGTDDDTTNGTTITLLSEYLLGGNRKYQAAGTSSQWNGSDLQGWLGSNSAAGDFLKEFNLGEQGAIKAQTMLESTTDNQGNPLSRTAGSSKVFILNGRGSNPESELDEFTKKFRNTSSVNNNYRICLDIHFQYPNWYWTRSCGSYPNSAAFVYVSGALDSNGYSVYDSPAIAVRPALKLNLTSVIFKSLISNSDLRNLFGFELKDAAAGGSNLIQNAYMLFCASKTLADTDVSLSVNGSKLTVSFDQRVAYAYNHVDPPVANNLKDKFEVTNGGPDNMVTAAAVVDGKIVLTLNKVFASGENTSGLTVRYDDYTTADTCGIGLLGTREYVSKINGGNAMSGVTNATPQPSSGGDDTTPTPSSNKTPGSVSAAAGSEKYPAERQTDGKTYLITVPYGTDISNLSVDVVPPAKGSVSPDMPVSHDFTKGPLTFTITAEDGSKKDYTIDVRVEEPEGPTEKALFTINVADCEIVVTQNEDGTLAVKVRIPFAAGSNPALLDTVRMIANSLGLSNVSYSYVDEQGSETPVTRMASAPYLEISGTAANMDAIKNGVITKIEYTLDNDGTQYVQTFANGGLKVAGMPGYPSPEPTPSGSSSSGCDAGMAGLAALALAGCVVIGRCKKD